MPSYGYLKWGCEVLSNPQQTIDYMTCSSEAPRLPFHIQSMSEPCLSARATNVSGQRVPYRSPELDDAPWYSPTAPSSGDFLGLVVSDMTGLDSTVNREITPRVVGIGGGSLGPIRAKHREIQVRATMYAASCEGMDHGMRWLTNVLYGGTCGPQDGCDLELWTGCPDDGTLQDSRWMLKRVSVLSGPTYSDGPFDYSPCNIREIEFTLASEEPWLYRCPINLSGKATAMTAPSTGCWSVCRWIDIRTQAALSLSGTGTLAGLDSFDLTFRAGPKRALSATVKAWRNTHGDANCSTIDPITLGDSSWLYEVMQDGSWLRWNINSDDVVSGSSTSGSGTITGATVAGDSSTYRDIKIKLPRSTYTQPLRIVNFRDCSLVGGTLTGGIVLDGWSGVAHLEGLRVSASTVGISGGSTGAYSELRISETHISGCSHTALWIGKMDEVRIDGLSIAESGLRGLWLDPVEADGIAQVAIRRFSAYTNSTSGVKSLFRQGGRYHTSLSTVFLAARNGYTGSDLYDSYCGPMWETFLYEPIGGNAVRWPSTSGIRGFVIPLDVGDIIDPDSVGYHYASADVDLGTPCAWFEIVDLPQNHSLKIESSTRRIVGYDPSGNAINGYAFVRVPEGIGLEWLESDCDPLCVKVEQRRGLEGDGSTLYVEQLHRAL